MPEFGLLNWTILIAYILCNIGLGFYFSKRIDSTEDYYIGRKVTPWWAIGISVIATYVSALSLLGGPAWSYTEGMSVMLIHMNYPLVIVLVITLFLPFFYNSGVASIYEYQERRFGVRARLLMATIFLVSQSLSSAAILYATSLVLQFITGIDVLHAIIIVTAIAMLYTVMGGITAVIWTDVLQAVIIFIITLVVLYVLIGELPGGLHETLLQLKSEGKTDPLNFSFDLSTVPTVWTGIFAMTMFHITVYGVNQMMVQRTLAAKSIGDAKKSYLLMGFVACFIYFIFILLGILFYAYYDGRAFDNGNTIILHFIADYGVPGLMGLLAAAVMAASMSTLDSSFNSMATITNLDFYQKYFRKHESDRHYLKASRIFTVVWGVLIIVPAIIFSQTEGSILEVLSKVGSFFVGAKLAMYGLGFFSKHTTEKGLLWGVATGFLVVGYVSTYTDLAWPWFCATGAIVNIVVAPLLSRCLDGPQKNWSPYSVPGQLHKYKTEGLAEKSDGWYVIPGKIDNISYVLILFFVFLMLLLFLFNALI